MVAVRAEASGNEDSADIQMAMELKLQSKEKRQKILKEAGFSLTDTPTVAQALAMKADVGIPWSKLRTLRRSAIP